MEHTNNRPLADTGDAAEKGRSLEASRRKILMSGATLMATGGAIFANRSEAMAAPFVRRTDAEMTSSVGAGKKFDAQGQAQRFGGNSFICHLPSNGAFRQIITDVRARLLQAPISPLFSIMPISSHHMTILEGVTDTQGRKAGWWPADLPFDAPLTTVHKHFWDKLRDFVPQSRKPFKMRRAELKPFGNGKGLTLLMEPANDETAHNLNSLRRSVSQLLELNQPGFDEYKHHITLGYSIVKPNDEEARLAEQLRSECEDILKSGPTELDLGPVEYVIFDDMLSFSPLLYLGGQV